MTWRVCQAGQQFDAEVQERWPDTIVWTVGDPDHASRPSDHNPFDHDDDPHTAEVVTAVDVLDDGRGQADEVWRFLLAEQPERVEYVIHDGWWAGVDTGWRVLTYHGSNKHRTHTHVSFGRGTDSAPTRPDLYDDPSPFGLADLESDMKSWIMRKWPSWFHDLAAELDDLDLANEHTEPNQRVGDMTLAQLMAVFYRFGRWIIREARA